MVKMVDMGGFRVMPALKGALGFGLWALCFGG